MRPTKTAGLAVIILGGWFLASPGQAGEIRGKVTAPELKNAANIVVYVDTISGEKFQPVPEHPVIDQRRIAFIPHVTVVLKGTTVDFSNSDPVMHNIYWSSVGGDTKLAHNLGTWSKGETRTFQFNDVGVVHLQCSIHPEMSAYIIVVPTPYFAVTDKDGNFSIQGIGPGRYTLKTWSEEGKAVTQTVTVSASGATVNLTLTK
jgi:plastocyanin